MSIRLSIEEQGQISTACWNERAKLEKQIKQRKQKGIAESNSNEVRVELLTTVIYKLKKNNKWEIY